jgi:hypothetical protein
VKLLVPSLALRLKRPAGALLAGEVFPDVLVEDLG